MNGQAMDRAVGQIAAESSILLFTWCVSLAGNILVCIVIYRSRRVQSTTNFFVVSLASSDILVTVLCIPFIASQNIASKWLIGSVSCRIVRFVQFLWPSSIMFTFASICVDRFYTIIYPLSFKVTRGVAKRLIFGCWLLAAVVCCMCLHLFETIQTSIDGIIICPLLIRNSDLFGTIYSVFLIQVTYVIPSVIIGVLQIKVFRYIWLCKGCSLKFKRTANHVPRAKVKMLKMLMIATVSTILLYLPFYLLHIWYSFLGSSYLEFTIFIAAFGLMYTTTALKPVFYMIYNSNFRRGCKEILCMSTSRCYRQNTYAITTASSIGKKNRVGIIQIDPNSRNNDSPSRTFNRSVHIEKGAWPIENNMASTYI
ncbi:hypothetical protein ACJMK2_019977 [Sinanodonta woodiana]|uniref:G-protein coupled receptors family 1 profile domain-containing protein n=1 Tax=Sinanodonta woodiana TaxID=1069815 RepID=A0ABD3TZS5_SINWO